MELNILEFFLTNTSVFACPQQMSDTTIDAEVAASRILLQAGYGINGITFDSYGVLFVKTNFDEKDYQEN